MAAKAVWKTAWGGRGVLAALPVLEPMRLASTKLHLAKEKSLCRMGGSRAFPEKAFFFIYLNSIIVQEKILL